MELAAVVAVMKYAQNAVLNHGHLEPGMHIMMKSFGVDELWNRVQELVGLTDGFSAVRG